MKECKSKGKQLKIKKCFHDFGFWEMKPGFDKLRTKSKQISRNQQIPTQENQFNDTLM